MADVEIMQSVSEVKKTKKVKKTSKRRESEVQITEVEQTVDEKGYVSFEFAEPKQRKFILNILGNWMKLWMKNVSNWNKNDVELSC